MKNSRKKILIAVISVLAVLILLCGVCAIIMLDCHKADMDAIDAFITENEVAYTTDGAYTVFAPKGATKGLIYYPGARVEHEVYLSLMEACADRGILCVLVEMPLYFPLIGSNLADGVREKYPEIEDWYIGGHSLGGYAASMYLDDHLDEFKGLILLASYTAVDLKGKDVDVLTVYGTEDQVMNRERYEEGLTLIPEDYTELVIEGGTHAFFGMYNGQDYDCAKGITNEEQLLLTADAIAEFMK